MLENNGACALRSGVMFVAAPEFAVAERTPDSRGQCPLHRSCAASR